MANALYVDALKGYEYYLSQRGKATLDQINEYLLNNGRHPVAHRTYLHYQKLLRNGFRSYIPINKFDVFEALGKVQLAADRRRYHRESSELEAEFSRDGKKWTPIKIIDQSIVGFGIWSERELSIPTGVSGWVKLKGYHEIPVVIVWKSREDGITRLGVRAIEFIANYRVEVEETSLRPSKLLTVRRETGDALDWDNIYNVLTTVDALIKAAADLLYSLQDIYDVDISLRRPVLQAIRFGSPGETSVKIDFGIADILRLVIEKLQFWPLQKRQLRAQVEAQELNNEAVKLANANTKIEMMRNIIKFGKETQDADLNTELVSGLKTIMPNLLGIPTSQKDSFAPDSPEYAILTQRLIPTALDLAAGDDTDFTVHIQDEYQ